MDALDDTERGVGALELLAQDREADVVHPGAAVGLRDRRAEEAQLAHLREQLAVDLALLVPLADERDDLGLGELADALRTSRFSSVRAKSTTGPPGQAGVPGL